MWKWFLGLFTVTAVSSKTVIAVATKFKNENAFNAYINEASVLYSIPVSVIKSIIATESGFNPNAKASTTSATGLMQLTVAAANQAGFRHVDMYNPRLNILAGTKYLRWLITTYGFSMNEAVQAYYAGQGFILDYKRKGTVTPRYSESKTYLAKVLNYKTMFNNAGVA